MSQQQNFNGFSSPAQAGVLQIEVDTSTPPGTDPVTPDVDGTITITGGQVAAGTTANVIQTNSLSASEFTIQIQRSQATASSTVGSNGACHFSSSDFTVDGNGFVEAVSPATFNWQVKTTDFTAANNNGYLINSVGLVNVTLPVGNVGDQFSVAEIASGQFTLVQNPGDTIQLADKQTTVSSGSITSTMQGDSISLVCWAAGPGASWVAVNNNGNFTIV